MQTVRADQYRVLVVDDETSINELLATALRYEGFDVTIADSGTSALATRGEQSAPSPATAKPAISQR